MFGSLFQSVMEPRERRQVGAHYTSERDILKLVRSLFLDDLRAEFERLKASKGTQREARLRDFHKKLGSLTFFDPACGCGNFLVVTYRELRLLEIDLLKELQGQQQVLDVSSLSRIDVDVMYGIEINEFPARIAEVALWLVDHQMNQRLGEAFGVYIARLPLKKSPHIHHANALRTDWHTVCPPPFCSYILGNPPFVGAKYQSDEQRADCATVAGGVKSSGLLDFVAMWYLKAATYIQNTSTAVAFVSTNSITQGEQVGVLWGELLKRGMRIRFAHRTFSWASEARGKAHVHVVIIGFGTTDTPDKRIYDYEHDANTPTVIAAKNISPYLVDGPDAVVVNRSRPLCVVPEVSFGSMPNDGGHLLLDDEARTDLINREPGAAQFIRRTLGSEEFIHNISRWCLWLVGASPTLLRDMPEVRKRIEAVRLKREASTREATQRLALTPSLFGAIRQPAKRYLGIPKTSSENRRYIPMAFLEPDIIAGSELFTCSDATNLHFGVLTSSMHMAWVRLVCGRLESRYRYSVKLVYNNYPWPEAPTEKQRMTVETAAQGVLDARAKFPDASLAALYDPLTMPADLTKAHATLDRAVDLCYRPKKFESDRERVEFLFELYEKLSAPLTAAEKPARRRKTSDPPAE